MMKKIVTVLVVIILILAYILFSPSVAGLRSNLALQIQGQSFRSKSVFNQVGLQLDIPTGKDNNQSGWTGNMKLYHPGNNFPHGEIPGEMSILYNFGDFEKGHSTFYDPNSEYFNAHYGLYAIHLEKGIFGWDNEKLNVEAITKVVAFDQLDLVMDSLGCPVSQRHFDYEITDIKEGPVMAGFSDWVQIDALINTNSPQHQQRENHLGYVQYGVPPSDYNGVDFPVVSMAGRLYLRYDSLHNVTIIYFVVGKTQKFINETSVDYLIPIQWKNLV